MPELTWLLLHIQQGDVIVQVGHGALGGAAPSPLGGGKHVPGEVQGALAATFLVAATDRVGERGEPQGPRVCQEGGASPPSPPASAHHMSPGLRLLRTSPEDTRHRLPGACCLVPSRCHLPPRPSVPPFLWTKGDSSHDPGRGTPALVCPAPSPEPLSFPAPKPSQPPRPDPMWPPPLSLLAPPLGP